MKINTAPMVDGGVPCVTLQVGEVKAQLTAKQAEEIAEALNRAATAARYESAIGEMIGETFGPGERKSLQAVKRVRELVEARKVRGN